MTVIAGRMESMEAPRCPMPSSDRKPRAGDRWKAGRGAGEPWGHLSGLCGLSAPHIPTSLPLILLYSACPNRTCPSRPHLTGCPGPHCRPEGTCPTPVLPGKEPPCLKLLCRFPRDGEVRSKAVSPQAASPGWGLGAGPRMFFGECERAP